MRNEKNTSENQQGHAPLAGVVLSPGLKYPDTPGKWRMEEYYQMAIEDEPRNHVSHWNIWERTDGVLMASNDNQTDPVEWLGYGNQRWIRED